MSVDLASGDCYTAQILVSARGWITEAYRKKVRFDPEMCK